MAKADPVAIVIAYSKSVEGDELLEYIHYGIEEEGIPYDMVGLDSDDAVELAKEGARRSKLGISVSLDSKKRGCINHVNFKDNEVLFLHVLDDGEDARILGTNSARLMKGIPFKSERAD